MGVDGATPSADAADIAICGEPGVTQMSRLLVQRAYGLRDRSDSRITIADTTVEESRGLACFVRGCRARTISAFM